MMAPRPTLLTYNEKDVYFASGRALAPLLQAARPVFELYDRGDYLRSHTNHDPGTHNFEKDNREALYRMLEEFFFGDREDFGAWELPCNNELKIPEDLHVDLPPDNASLHSLAVSLSRQLPKNPDIPTDPPRFRRWQQSRRTELAEIVRAKSYLIQAERISQRQLSGITAIHWRLRMGTDWTVPAVELARGQPQETVIVVADSGRRGAAAAADHLLADGKRVIAVDLFSLGESSADRWTWLYALLISSIGERPLGLQASQLSAVARWLQDDRRTGSVTVVSAGPRCSVITLVAAGLEEQAIAGVQLKDALTSLKEVIDQNWTVEQAPELFCFGLFQAFDLEQLTALIAPRKVLSR
jgi:hypothetical protein